MSGMIMLYDGGTDHAFRPVVMGVIFNRMRPHLNDVEAMEILQSWESIGDILLFFHVNNHHTDLQLWHALKLAVEDLLESGPRAMTESCG